MLPAAPPAAAPPPAAPLVVAVVEAPAAAEALAAADALALVAVADEAEVPQPTRRATLARRATPRVARRAT